ncbi:hypothetical protein TSUD_413340 [Trifolium subterraneum]|uniref:DUF4283 domain-containing protein n=1 Tax=Trifolium subterraneum TaxID=3900 RepID=A0A2Z6P4S8_TRISU|nr:hypothetical protein TSUD_413340 [Trifolium subterraneum]
MKNAQGTRVTGQKDALGKGCVALSGAWVHLYGVPLHAWNVNFFKLCVFDCGRVERVLVDRAKVEIKIVEEWGYTMGEDTCLFEEENETEESPSEYEERNVDMEVGRNVDTLVDKIVDGLEEEEDEAFQVHSNEVLSDKPVDILFVEGEKGGEVGHDQFTGNLGPLGEAGEQDLRIGDTPQQLDTQERPLLNNNLGESESGAENQRRSNRATTCPPAASRSAFSGPWSLVWLQDRNHGEAGVIFSASNRKKKGGQHGVQQKKWGHPDPKRRKAGGLLRHPIHSLKKVPRMPSEDRDAVLKVLKKNGLQRQGGKGVSRSCSASCQDASEESSSPESITNDWQNWVAMQGNDQMVMEDVSVGVSPRGQLMY